ncbi:MAG: aminotransferase class I/II-fold pyridoxal phosphate-dependent enzyme [Caldilineaceae bacterium]|nr:aminotransferase class I/II-fold pyridoxal phosphate-dependent enzyme [Caldilineaceae bacterium]
MSPVGQIPHGTLDYAEVAALGVRPDDLLVFSSNINPYGPPPAVVKALRAALTPAIVARYPDRLSLELRARLAAYHRVPETAILVGNGTADLLWLIGLLHLRQRRIAVLTPTFGEYENVAALMAAPVTRVDYPGWQRRAEGIFTAGENAVANCAQALAAAQPEVVFVCNPNNPTGQVLHPDELEQLYAAAPAALWIVDEAYSEFMALPVSSIPWIERGNWLVLRSMTKDFALGGLRLGYVAGAPALIGPLQQAQSPWNTNSLAQLAGIACMDQLNWRKTTLAQLRADCAALRRELQAAGFTPRPTTVNYFLMPVADPARLRAVLLQRRIVIRDCTSFGLPSYVRIATQQPDANRRLVAALVEYGSGEL